jgi:hypothetical protein
MKNLFLSTTFILMSLVVCAQDSVLAVSRNRFAHIDFGVGFLKTDLGSVNTSLTSFGFKPLQEDFITLSVSSGYFVKRFLIRNELTLLLPNSVAQAGDVTTSFGGYNLGVGIGYAIIQNPKFRLYPYVGINAFTTRLRIEDDAPAANMNDVINSPHRTSQLYFSNASLDAGFQLDKVIALKNRKWDCPQNAKFMTIGIRAGYHFGPGPIQGRYNGIRNISDAPTYSMKGPYVKLVIGFGAKQRDLRWRK